MGLWAAGRSLTAKFSGEQSHAAPCTLTLNCRLLNTASASDLSWELLANAGDALSILAPLCLYVTDITSQAPPVFHPSPPPRPPHGSHQHPLHATNLAWHCSSYVLSVARGGWGVPSPVPRKAPEMLEPCPPDTRAMSPCPQVRAWWPGSVHKHLQSLQGSSLWSAWARRPAELIRAIIP